MVRGASGVWKSVAGPTRVVNLLECASVTDFEQKATQAFYPTPFIPSLGLSPPPTYDAALTILKLALLQLSMDTPLIVFVEDINSLPRMAGWQAAFTRFAVVVASNNNGIVVGNSSALLGYTNFESLPHTGLRTARFFLASLPRDSEELAKYAADGGHLFRAGFSPPNQLLRPDLSHRMVLWNGNVQMIKVGSDSDAARVLSRVRTVLQTLSLDDKPQWAHLVTSAGTKTEVLKQRSDLLQLLCDSPNNEVPLLSLPAQMVDLRIAEQLAAVDLVTFRTLKDAEGREYEAVAPYHPVVLAQFRAHKAARVPWW